MIAKNRDDSCISPGCMDIIRVNFIQIMNHNTSMHHNKRFSINGFLAKCMTDHSTEVCVHVSMQASN